MESASAAVQEIRDRIRSPAEEYKANHLLREKHRAVLEWLLAPSGPLHGHAYVHLTEKTYFMVERVLDLLLGDPGGALPLCRAGADTFGAERWKRVPGGDQRPAPGTRRHRPRSRRARRRVLPRGGRPGPTGIRSSGTRTRRTY